MIIRRARMRTPLCRRAFAEQLICAGNSVNIVGADLDAVIESPYLVEERNAFRTPPDVDHRPIDTEVLGHPKHRKIGVIPMPPATNRSCRVGDP